jgi:aryl-alcohol dehydrogenase-like predicted oxidoreductase
MIKTDLVLGTAMWGWNISEYDCFKILDDFYSQGCRKIDCATNYPINKKYDSFRKSENIICDWIRTNKIKDLKLNIKIGSIDNQGSSINNLNKSFILMNYNLYKEKFNENLDQIMIHWDNRIKVNEINKTIEALEILKTKIKIGFSGLKYPNLYKKFIFENEVNIQIKNNVFLSNYNDYKIYHGKKIFTAYGINASGYKLTGNYKINNTYKTRNKNKIEIEKETDIRKKIIKFNIDNSSFKINTFNEIGIIYSYFNDDIKEIIIGPSNINQLNNSINFLDKINSKYCKYKTILTKYLN